MIEFLNQKYFFHGVIAPNRQVRMLTDIQQEHPEVIMQML